jgi:hypothetical protein
MPAVARGVRLATSWAPREAAVKTIGRVDAAATRLVLAEIDERSDDRPAGGGPQGSPTSAHMNDPMPRTARESPGDSDHAFTRRMRASKALHAVAIFGALLMFGAVFPGLPLMEPMGWAVWVPFAFFGGGVGTAIIAFWVATTIDLEQRDRAWAALGLEGDWERGIEGSWGGRPLRLHHRGGMGRNAPNVLALETRARATVPLLFVSLRDNRAVRDHAAPGRPLEGLGAAYEDCRVAVAAHAAWARSVLAYEPVREALAGLLHAPFATGASFRWEGDRVTVRWVAPLAREMSASVVHDVRRNLLDLLAEVEARATDASFASGDAEGREESPVAPALPSGSELRIAGMQITHGPNGTLEIVAPRAGAGHVAVAWLLCGAASLAATFGGDGLPATTLLAALGGMAGALRALGATGNNIMTQGVLTYVRRLAVLQGSEAQGYRDAGTGVVEADGRRMPLSAVRRIEVARSLGNVYMVVVLFDEEVLVLGHGRLLYERDAWSLGDTFAEALGARGAPSETLRRIDPMSGSAVSLAFLGVVAAGGIFAAAGALLAIAELGLVALTGVVLGPLATSCGLLLARALRPVARRHARDVVRELRLADTDSAIR